MASLARFNAELKNIEDNITPKMARKMVLVAAISLHGKIVRKTRVDTGNARANWNVKPGGGDEAVTEIGRPGIGAAAASIAALAKQRSLAGLQPFQKVTIYNNVPYIRILEFGGPGRPGDATIATSLAEFRVEAPRLFQKITFSNIDNPVQPST